MGIEFVLVDTEKKIFYYLGKGNWFDLIDMEAFQDKEYLYNEVATECYWLDDEEYWKDSVKKQEAIDYLTNKVIPELYENFHDSNPKKLSIVSDCIDDYWIIKAKGYRCVGSRYTDDSRDLNAHLKEPKPRGYTLGPNDDPFNKY